MIESVPLLQNKKEYFVVFGIAFLLLALSFSYEYFQYSKLKANVVYKTEAKVLSLSHKLSKNGKPYEVYKLKTSHFTFYTVLWRAQNIEPHTKVIVKFSTKDIDFIGYLRGFFAPSSLLKMLEETPHDSVKMYVKNQHESSLMQELYGALFFADATSKILKQKINQWGISHLIAISGFHLGILSALLFLTCKPIYMWFQDRYFPYRNAKADLAFLILLILGTYAYYIDGVASVLRAYAMSVVGFFIFSHHIKLLSFSNLLISVVALLILFPKLLFSVAFLFSVSGVFFIFVFLHHFATLPKIAILFLINLWAYVVMLPIIHYVFELFTWYQLFSMPLSVLFVVFYPLSLFLHVINFGDIFDSFIELFLNLNMQIYALHVSLVWLGIYLLFSLLAMRYKLIALCLPIVAICILSIENIT